MTFGTRVKYERERAASRSELAKLVGISQALLSKIKPKRRPFLAAR